MQLHNGYRTIRDKILWEWFDAGDDETVNQKDHGIGPTGSSSSGATAMPVAMECSAAFLQAFGSARRSNADVMRSLATSVSLPL